jgi:hypothetical protein
MTNDKKTSEMSSESTFLTGLFALPILIPFTLLGRFQQGLGACACLATVLIIARYRWDLRKHASFWIVIAVLLLMQLPIVVYVPWTAKGLNGRAMMPLALADGAIGMGLVKLAEMAVKKKELNSKESTKDDPIQDS